MYATFERFEIKLTKAQAFSASQPGKDAAADVNALLALPEVKRQLDKIPPLDIAAGNIREECK